MRRQHLRQLRRDRRLDLDRKAAGGAAGQAPAACLHGPAHVVHELGPGADEAGPGADPREVPLGGRAAVPDRRQQGGIDPTQPRQLLGVVAIILVTALGDPPHPDRVRHQHFMASRTNREIRSRMYCWQISLNP